MPPVGGSEDAWGGTTGPSDQSSTSDPNIHWDKATVPTLTEATTSFCCQLETKSNQTYLNLQALGVKQE